MILQGVARKIVLLVEDNADIREIFAICLEEAGFDVRQAEDGIQSLPLLRGLLPNAVITDLVMPNMGGAELAKFIKNDPELSHIPIGLITATPPSSALAGMPYFSRILTKPCSVDDLVNLAEFLASYSVPLLRYK